MGAMHNDLNRCNFMYADDRRCRNLIQNPGNPFCVYHCEAAAKKNQAAKPTVSDPANSDPTENDVAARAFILWLSENALDNATDINQALNQLFCLVLRNRVSARQADCLLRTLRLMLKAVPDVREEFQIPGYRAHARQGHHFLAELRELMTLAAAEISASAPEEHQPEYQQPEPEDHQPAHQSQDQQPQDRQPQHQPEYQQSQAQHPQDRQLSNAQSAGPQPQSLPVAADLAAFEQPHRSEAFDVRHAEAGAADFDQPEPCEAVAVTETEAPASSHLGSFAAAASSSSAFARSG